MKPLYFLIVGSLLSTHASLAFDAKTKYLCKSGSQKIALTRVASNAFEYSKELTKYFDEGTLNLAMGGSSKPGYLLFSGGVGATRPKKPNTPMPKYILQVSAWIQKDIVNGLAKGKVEIADQVYSCSKL